MSRFRDMDLPDKMTSSELRAKDLDLSKPLIVVFHGCRRSGQHAIIHWFVTNFTKGETLKCIHGHDLFRMVYANGDRSVMLYNDCQGGLNVATRSYWNFPCPSTAKYIFYLFEERGYDSVVRETAALRPDHHIILLRDPFNLAASRLLGREINVCRHVNIDFRCIWKRHAELVKYGHSHIIYNLWLNKSYRDSICDQYKIVNHDQTGYVDVTGGGSSFGSTTDYLRRYKKLTFPVGYLEWLKSSDIHELCRDVFSDLTIEFESWLSSKE